MSQDVMEQKEEKETFPSPPPLLFYMHSQMRLGKLDVLIKNKLGNIAKNLISLPFLVELAPRYAPPFILKSTLVSL